MRGIIVSCLLRRGHPAVSEDMLVSSSEGMMPPLACEITMAMKGIIFLTTGTMWWLERRLENESSEIWACQKGERLSSSAHGRRTSWRTSLLTVPWIQRVGAWVGRKKGSRGLGVTCWNFFKSSNCSYTLISQFKPMPFEEVKLNENLLPCCSNHVDSLGCWRSCPFACTLKLIIEESEGAKLLKKDCLFCT